MEVALFPGMRRFIAKVTRALSRSSWTPLIGRGVLGIGAFLALAHIGAGAAAHLPTADVARLAAAHGTVPSPEAVARASPRASPSSSASAASPCPRAAEARGPIVLNEADADTLTRLPGVGAKRAEAIVRLRDKLGGRFRRLRDLMRVRGIGYRSFQKLKPMVVLDAPEEEPDGSR